VKRDGVSLGQPFEVPLDTARVFGNLHMYGNAIGLSGIPELGPYDFVFEIVDSSSETSVERAVSIEITE
jgi:hypothetical protein